MTAPLTPAAFDALLTGVSAPTDRHPFWSLLPGRSSAVARVACELVDIRERLTRPPADGRVGVAVVHPPAPDWFSNELLNCLGVPPEAVCELRPATPVSNAGILFGRFDQPGLLEAGHPTVLGLAGVGALGPARIARLRGFVEVWWQARPPSAAPHLVFTAQDGGAVADAANALGLQVVRMPALAGRGDDFAHVLNAVAERHGGALGVFDPDAFAALAAHPWPGDLLELCRVVERLLAPPVDRGVTANRVRECLTNPFVALGTADSAEGWLRLRRACDRCDSAARELVERACFEPTDFDHDPFTDPSPRGQFFALIAWAYRRFHEAGKAMLDYLTRHPLADPSERAEMTGLRERFNQLRQLFQHHQPAGRPLKVAAVEWLTAACGRTTPDDWQYEECVGRAVADLTRLAERVAAVLTRLRDHPERRRIVAELEENLNLTWSAQRRREFITDWLKANTGWRVNTRPIADRWLADFQQRVRALAHMADEERQERLREWVKVQYAADLLARPLVTGRDLVELGVLETDRAATLETLQLAQLNGEQSRVELLKRIRVA